MSVPKTDWVTDKHETGLWASTLPSSVNFIGLSCKNCSLSQTLYIPSTHNTNLICTGEKNNKYIYIYMSYVDTFVS